METPKTAGGPASSANQAKQIANLRGHLGGIIGLAFSPDRCLIASSSRDGTGRVWEVASKKPGERGSIRQHGDPFHALVFAPNSRMLAVGSGTQSGQVWLYDLSGKTPQETAVLKGGKGSVDALAFSPDGKL
ncbi:MAG TPA: hypothetical protein VKE74_34950, partial [Gemmataceae bacterium]|nr:hypothetical protein [Gemmataceae bacterium]